MIHFWNGNKSAIRQEFELKALQLALSHSALDDAINHDVTDHPNAEDEGLVFSRGTDVLVTVAGNRKFVNGSYTMIPQPLCRGLLGCRVLIVHKDRLAEFKAIHESQLKQLIVGIPATWADADLFRANQYQVNEYGDLQQQLLAVQHHDCDYMALGVNEAAAILSQHADLVPDLVVEPTVMLYYPFPLVFYCHPARDDLQQSLSDGLEQCIKNGELEALFEQVYAADVKAAKLKQRRVFQLTNPILPSTLANYQSDLLPVS